MNQTITERIRKIFAYAKAHKIISIITIAIVLYVGSLGYKSFRSTTSETRYVLSTVQKGAIVVSLSGSGQVSTSNQIDLKPKVSGDITWVAVKAGAAVHAGQTLAQIDNTTAKQSIADAEQTLIQSKLQFQKDTSQAPIDYQKMLESLSTATVDLSTTYSDTFNTLSNAYLDLPNVITGMHNALYGYDLNKERAQQNLYVLLDTVGGSDSAILFGNKTVEDYAIARAKYDKSIIDYKTLTRYSDTAYFESQLISSIDTVTAVAQALQTELNFIDSVIDYYTLRNFTINPTVNTIRTNVRTYLATANTNLSALLNQQKTLGSIKNTIRDVNRNIEIYKIGNQDGSNPISLQSSQYNIADQERKLQQLRDNLLGYTITAPFAGVVSVLNTKQFDTVSTGTTIATLITNQKIAQISFNEVDASRVKIGQKATLTFDAVDELSIVGNVIDIDTVGTVSQGVVTYTVKVAFGTQDDRVKSGMSVSAAIITDMKQDVLVIPNSALKISSGTSYVEVFDTPLVTSVTSTPFGANAGLTSSIPPRQQVVVVGLSSDSETEIISGLTEWEQIVTRVITTTTTATTQAPSILNATGVRTSGMGGATRAVNSR